MDRCGSKRGVVQNGPAIMCKKTCVFILIIKTCSAGFFAKNFRLFDGLHPMGHCWILGLASAYFWMRHGRWGIGYEVSNHLKRQSLLPKNILEYDWIPAGVYPVRRYGAGMTVY